MKATAHSPASRATAQAPAAGPCRDGRLTYDPASRKTKWQPVKGPHLGTIRSVFARNTTGVVGISRGTKYDRAAGVRREYYIANLGSASKAFNIGTLGEATAWRRALACRAAYERHVAERNQRILARRAQEDTRS